MKEIMFLSVFLILAFSSIWDMKFKKIPNALILFGLFTGVVMSTYSGGLTGLRDSLIGICISWLVFILFWGVWAAGDIKLLMVIASFVGAKESIEIGFLSLLLGAIVFIFLNPKRFYESGQNMLYFLFYKMPIQPVMKSESIAFSPYILLASIVMFANKLIII